MAENAPSAKYLAARETLPAELRPVFDEFVQDYRFAATLRVGSPLVSYAVLADMVRAGWRRAAPPLEPPPDTRGAT